MLPFLNIIRHQKTYENCILEIYFIDKYCYDKPTGEFSPIHGEKILYYKGRVAKGRFNGDGTLEFENGIKYDGLFVGGVFVKGTLIKANGNRYTGSFISGYVKNGSFMILKNQKISTEYYVYGIKTNLIYLKNKIGNFMKSFNKKSGYVRLDDEEMKLKKD